MTASTLSISLETINEVYLKDGVDGQKLSHEELADILFLASIEKITKGFETSNINKSLSEYRLRFQNKTKPLPKKAYQKIVNTYSFEDITKGIIIARSLGFCLPQELNKKTLKPNRNTQISKMLKMPAYDSEEQVRLYSIIERGHEGIIDTQGMAGVGKSSVLYAAAKALATNSSGRIAWIVSSDELKRKAMTLFTGNKIQVFSPFDLSCSYSNPMEQWGERFGKIIDRQTLLQKIGIYDTDFGGSKNEANRIASLVALTTNRFCHSYNQNFTTQHLPTDIPGSLCDIALELSKRYWSMILDNNNNELPVKPIHHIKFVHLNRYRLRGKFRFNHLFVDESQNFSPCVMSIINTIIGRFSKTNYLPVSSAIIAGDKHQALGSANEWVKDDGGFDEYKSVHSYNHYGLYHSIRFGSEIAAVCNYLLKSKVGNDTDEVIGCDYIGSKISEVENCFGEIFKLAEIEPMTFLSESLWTAFLFAYKMRQNNMTLYVSKDTRKALQHLIASALLFRNFGQSYHAAFTAYQSWSSFFRANSNEIIKEVDAIFKTGFDKQDLEKLLEETSSPYHSTHIISMIGHNHGMEHNKVMLLPGPSDLSSPIIRQNEKYTAASRAKSELILPKGFIDSLLD